jgi:alpha-L-fucosidase
VGPRPDGTITEEETAVLQDLGRWLKINGEGIYDTIPWKTYGEGSCNAEGGYFTDGEEKGYTAEDFRFTYKGGSIYAFQMRPDGRDVTIRSFRANGMYDFGIENVRLLGSNENINFRRDSQGLHIALPKAMDTEFPLGFKVSLM